MTPQQEEIKKQWVAALRSGDYKQGTNVLQHHWRNRPDISDSFCCLGVLCDMAVKAGVIPPPFIECSHIASTPSRAWYGVGVERVSTCLPPTVMKWAGIVGASGQFYDGTSATSLANLNDGGYSFADIANKIESNPKGLFTDE